MNFIENKLITLRMKVSFTLTRSKKIILLTYGIDKKKSNWLAKQLGKTTQTVREWLTQWDTVGLACLFTGHAANLNSSKLKTEQWEQVCEVLQASPSADSDESRLAHRNGGAGDRRHRAP